MQGSIGGQGESRDRRIEAGAVLGQHLIVAAHAADGGFQDGAAGVLELLARRQLRLLAENAFAVDFLYALIAVGDDPVPGQQGAPWLPRLMMRMW